MGRYFIEKEHHGQMIIEERTPYYSHKKNNPFSLAIMTTGKKMGEANKEDGTQFGPWHREVSVPEMSDSKRGKRLDRLDDQCHMECKKICFRILDM